MRSAFLFLELSLAIWAEARLTIIGGSVVKRKGLFSQDDTLHPTIDPTVTTQTFQPTISPGFITVLPSQSSYPSNLVSLTSAPSVAPTTYLTPLPPPSYSPSFSLSTSLPSSSDPTSFPSLSPTPSPSSLPSSISSTAPSSKPSSVPSSTPSYIPSSTPSNLPSSDPSSLPTSLPSSVPSFIPSSAPSHHAPTISPSAIPTRKPSKDHSLRPTKRPTITPTLLPTPYGKAGVQWWYYTRAYLSLQWNNQELTIDDVCLIMNSGLREIFSSLMFPTMIEGMETLINVGTTERVLRLTTAADDMDDDDESDFAWDDFTLEVWSVAHGSSEQIKESLEIVINDPDLLTSKLMNYGMVSAKTVFIHGIHLSTTDIPPESYQTESGTPPDPEKIVWIIILTLILFAMGVAGIVEIRRRCIERQSMEMKYDPSKPPSVASLCCPCMDFTLNEERNATRQYDRKKYLKAHIDEDTVLDDSIRSTIEMKVNGKDDQIEEFVVEDELSSAQHLHHHPCGTPTNVHRPIPRHTPPLHPSSHVHTANFGPSPPPRHHSPSTDSTRPISSHSPVRNSPPILVPPHQSSPAPSPLPPSRRYSSPSPPLSHPSPY